MRVGVVILPDRRWSRAERRWQAAEEYGFDHAWTYDHIGWESLAAEPWFDAVPTLTAAAMVTSTIRLGTLVASPNFRHPVHFARTVTALDDISGGRLTVGIGAGGTGVDAHVLGEPPLSVQARGDRFAEFVELLDRLLTGHGTAGGSIWRGRYYTAVGAYAAPGCRQTPRVPFVIAAEGIRSARLAARFGQGWVTTGRPADELPAWWRSVAESAHRFDETLVTSGRDPSSVHRYLFLDAAPVFSLSSAACFADMAGRAAELGFTDVVTHWPRETGPYAGDPAVLETVAADVLPTLGQG